MDITLRDAEILRLLRRHRFLRSHHVATLLGGSSQQLLRRLQKLYHHGYIERPVCQLDYFKSGGSRSMVHALGNRGAAFLLRTENSARLDFSARNRFATRLFLDHALMVSDILVALEIACRQRGNARLRYADSMALTSRSDAQWSIAPRGGARIAVIPDAIFALETTRADGATDSVLFCLEADRGTMPVQSANPLRTSIARKLIAYEASWRANIFRQRFHAARVQVLTVTNSAARLESISVCASGYVSAGGLFHFSTLDEILAAPDAFLDSLLARWQPAHPQHTLAFSATSAA